MVKLQKNIYKIGLKINVEWSRKSGRFDENNFYRKNRGYLFDFDKLFIH